MSIQERNKAIEQLRKEGWTLQSIAEKFSVSRERVRQIISKQEWKRRQDKNKKPFDYINELKNCNFDIKEYVNSGILDKEKEDAFFNCFRVRARNALNFSGIEKINDFCNMMNRNPMHFKNIPNIGRTTKHEIVEFSILFNIIDTKTALEILK